MFVSDLCKFKEPENLDDVSLDFDQLAGNISLVVGLSSLFIDHLSDFGDLFNYLLVKGWIHSLIATLRGLNLKGAFLSRNPLTLALVLLDRLSKRTNLHSLLFLNPLVFFALKLSLLLILRTLLDQRQTVFLELNEVSLEIFWSTKWQIV